MRHVACALLIVLPSFIGVAGAQEFEPRLYSNIPQAHLMRSFDRGIWIAFDATRHQDGQTHTDSVPNRNRQSNSRFGLTLCVPIDSRHSVKFNASSGIATRTGSDFDTVGPAWQYRWGPAT